MKRMLTTALVIGSMPGAAMAATGRGLQSATDEANKFAQSGALPGTGMSLEDTLGAYIGNFLGLLGLVFVVLMIYAGYLYLTAQGNEEQVEKAKEIIKNAVIGMVIISLAYVITRFVIANIQ